MRRSVRLCFALVSLVLFLVVPPADAAPPAGSDSEITALFVRYYSAVKKGRWDEAHGLLHERLKKAMNVQTPRELAIRDVAAQQNLIDGFRRFDNLEVAKTEVDLASIKGTVTASGDSNVAGQVVYDLVVFPIGPGRPPLGKPTPPMKLSPRRAVLNWIDASWEPSALLDCASMTANGR